MTDGAGPIQADAPDRLEFDYIKSNFFRVIYSEGVFGGISPRGMITFALYNERGPIPQKTAVQVVDGVPQLGAGAVSAEEILASRSGIVREVEAQVVMSIETATAFHAWLGDKLEIWRRLTEEGHVR